MTAIFDRSTTHSVSEATAPVPADTDVSRHLVDLIRQSLEDDKAEDIVVIDLAGKTSIADYMVIATGRSTRQVGALAEKLQERLKAAGYGPAAAEGTRTCDWVVVDALDVVVHIFRPEVREFYNLEKMWQTPSRPARMANA